MEELKKVRLTIEYKAKILKEIRETKNVALVARTHGLNYQTVSGWVRSERLSAVRLEDRTKRESSTRLQKLELENKILKELLKKTNQAWLSEEPSLSHLSMRGT